MTDIQKPRSLLARILNPEISITIPVPDFIDRHISPKMREKTKRFFDSKTWFFISALIFPNTWKKGGIYVAAYALLLPWTSMLFPRAETVLEENGLDPKIVGELAPGKRIYIRDAEKTFLASAHALLDRGSLAIPFNWGYVFGNKASAYAQRSALPYDIDTKLGLDIVPCRIHMRPKSQYEDSLKIFREGLGLESNDTLVPDINTYYKFVLLHEIRHCSKENVLKEEPANEADSDYHAIRVISREQKDPSLVAQLSHLRTVFQMYSTTHNTILYIDAKMKGETPPTAEEMQAANEEANIAIMRIKLIPIYRERGLCKDPAVAEVLCPTRIDLSSKFAIDRVKLYQDAIQYYQKVPAKPPMPADNT